MSAPAVPVSELRTPELVQDLVDQRVWFAVNETERRHPDGNARHRRLCAVVDELRKRGVLD